MAIDREAVFAAIVNAISATDEDGLFTPERLHDIAFHLTDWLDDFEALYEVCSAPDAKSPEEITNTLIGFLYHVPNHVAAAARLYLDSPVRDIFGIGAVEGVDGPSTPPAG